MRGKRIKEKLRAGQPVFTTGLRFHAPRLVELLARSGADQIFLGAEHGPITEAECEEMVRAADLHDVPVAIRVPANEPARAAQWTSPPRDMSPLPGCPS
jgi:4-hydroxy-2-oxoheptanedioate aldolase